MLKVAIATSSSEKINGIIEAISRTFNIEKSEIEFYFKATESGVPEQPMREETYIGAFNRVEKIQSDFPQMDFYISCEAGIENVLDLYFNVQVVCIFDTKLKKCLWGKSSGWLIPTEDIEKIKNHTLDSYLRGKGINSIEELLGTSHSRKISVMQATELALAYRNLMK